MTVTTHGAHRSDTVDLTGRVEALEAALRVADGQVTRSVGHRVATATSGVRERLRLGVDHTIVALVGGTGSGKSSLFNAISGLDFADVGVRRPTTSQVTACVWGSSSGALLDWLGVAAHRRIERESELDADTEVPLRGLVLLDLPDHDSIAPAHREVVDQLLPMADLLVWVVDPQKYADDALHSGYLRRLAGQEAAMVVVLNQIDSVPVDVRERLETDVARLLREDGLVGVRVLSVSARTGEGIAHVRALLAETTAQRSTAAVRAGAEVARAATLLGRQVAAHEPGREDLPVNTVVDSLAGAAGLGLIADALAAAVRGGDSTVPGFGAVRADTVELARARWLTTVGAALPARWRYALSERVSGTDALRRAVDERLAKVAVTVLPSRGAAAFAIACVVAVAGAVVTGARALLTLFGADAAASWLGGAGFEIPLPVALGLFVFGVLFAALALAVRRRDGLARAAAMRRDGRAALGEIVEEHLVVPTLAVLGEHREVRELAAVAAALEPTTAPTAAGSSPG